MGNGTIAGMFGAFSALVLVVPCFWKRRVLCRTVCPSGFCFDTIARIRRKATGSCKSPKILRRFPKLGTLLALFTWAGCCVGAVGFLFLDPFVLFGSLFHSGILIFVFGFLAMLAFAAPSFWCERICPLGGVQDILYVPKSFWNRKAVPNPPAIAEPPSLLRRRMLGRGLLCFLAAVVFGDSLRRTRRIAAESMIHPPGAVQEPYFSALCTRCGNCVRACPSGILKARRFQDGMIVLGTPKVDFVPGWCTEECNACSRACPSGAIKPFSVAEKKDHPLGLAVFTFEYCRLYEDIECSICSRECPHEAISYEWSEEEYRRFVRIDPQKCTGCGRCVVRCPVVGENTEKTEIPLTINPRG